MSTERHSRLVWASVGLLLSSLLLGLAVYGMTLEQGMRVVGTETAVLTVLGAVLAWRRVQSSPGTAKGWKWFIPLFLAACGHALLMAFPPRGLIVETWRTGLWWFFSIVYQFSGLAALFAWHWQLRNPRRLLLDALGAVLFCGSLLLILMCAVKWNPIAERRHLLDSAFLTNCMRVILWGGIGGYLLMDRPSRWRGPLGWYLLNVVVGTFTLAILYPFWLQRVTWIQTPLAVMAQMVQGLLVLAVLGGGSLDPAEEDDEKASALWAYLPYGAFLLAGALALTHYLIWPAQARMVVLGLVALLFPLLGRQMLLLREIQDANANLEDRVETRTHDLAVSREAHIHDAARLRVLLDTIPDLVWLKDAEGLYLACNRRFEQFLGVPEAGIIGKSDYDLLDADLATFFRAHDLAAIAAGGPTMNEETVTFKSDGHQEDLETIKAPLTAPGGEILGVLGIGRDITARKQSERERIALQARQLQSQKMESLGVLAGGVAHDMNNVLAAILAMASSQLVTADGDNPRQRVFKIIEEAALRGGSMVKKLLNFARQNPQEIKVMQINTVLQETVSLLERTTLSRIKLRMELDEQLRAIEGDPGDLAHAVMNLCVNATDAMPDGGTLTLRTRNVGQDRVALEVADTGSGMPKAVLDRALDPFFTTKPTGKGTGLGLAMVFSMVQAHGGQMDIQSEPGAGTVVRLVFPATRGSEAEAVAHHPGEASPRTSLNLLLVDDDELIQEASRHLVNALGHTLTLASSGERALEMIQGGLSPDAVILDLNMPGLGGRGTLPLLRAGLPGVPILLATGRADQDAIDLVSANPGVTLLAKPFGLQDLQNHLDAFMGQALNDSNVRPSGS